jgi:hypothetical protein
VPESWKPTVTESGGVGAGAGEGVEAEHAGRRARLLAGAVNGLDPDANVAAEHEPLLEALGDDRGDGGADGRGGTGGRAGPPAVAKSEHGLVLPSLW